MKNAGGILTGITLNVSIALRYKINTQKSVVFLYINNEAAEREIKESIPFASAPKTIRYLAINLLKR